MAGSINKVTLMGRVGKDPELRTLQSGQRMASFSVATSESWKDKHTQERQEKTEWHNVVVFNERTADVIDKYVRKGDMIAIEGQIQTRKWTDRDGKDRYSTEIVVSAFRGEVTLIGRIENHGGGRGAGSTGRLRDREPGDDAGGYGGDTGYQPAAATANGATRPARGRNDDLDDEIPF